MQQDLLIQYDVDEVELYRIGMSESLVADLNSNDIASRGRAIGIRDCLLSLDGAIKKGNINAIKMYMINVAQWNDKSSIERNAQELIDRQKINDLSSSDLEKIKDLIF